MVEWIKISLDVAGRRPGELISDVTAYLPFDGALFAAQQHVKMKGLWMIVHVPTTALVPGFVAAFDTRAEALAAAGRLSRECPAAAHVRLSADHKMIGPFPQMRDQILASLKAPA